MKNIPIITLFFLTFTAFSQEYIPLNTSDTQERTLLLQKIEKRSEEVQKNIKKKYKGDLKKEISYSHIQLFELITDKVKNKELVFDTVFADYINSITKDVIAKNQSLIKGDLNAYITKHNSVNALSTGNGYVFLNMGLFKYLKNEAQLVAVLCHEMAHDILKHSENSIINSAKLETSKDKKKIAKKIREKKYNKQSEAFGEFKKILYTSKKKHRKQEVQADSLGFLLFKNTKYNPKAFLNTLKEMAHYDSLPNITLKKETYEKVFNLPKQPFKKEWLKKEDFDAYNYDHYKTKINEDSIKSHPEIVDRINFVKTKFAKDLKTSKQVTNSGTFKKLSTVANYESVLNLFYAENYGFSTYVTLYKLEKDPNNKYFKEILGKNFNKIYEAKKNYKLNRYVESLNPKEQDESYMQFLNFIWNLRLQEMETIKNYYFKG